MAETLQLPTGLTLLLLSSESWRRPPELEPTGPLLHGRPSPMALAAAAADAGAGFEGAAGKR